MNTEGGKTWFGIGIDTSNLKKDAERSNKIFDSIGANAEKEGRRVDAAFKKIAGGLTALLSVEALRRFASEIIKVRGEMEMLENSFDVLLGGKGVKKFTDELKKFAVESPLSLSSVSNAAQTILGFNVEAEKTIPLIKQIGDISMGNEQRFQSLALAFSQMYSIGHLMGQDLLQMINAGFNPLIEISQKTGKTVGELREEMSKGAITAEMVADAFRVATEEGGRFYGMTQKQAEGVKGLQAKLKGELQEALNTIGAQQQGLITSGYKAATTLVKNYESIGKTLMAIIGTYGTYKAAVMTVNIVMKEQAAINAMVAASGGVFNKSLAAQWLWTERLQKAQARLNKTMLTNPYVLAATAIAALVAVIYLYSQRATAAERAQKRHNDELQKAADKKEELKVKTDSLASAIKDETKSIEQQIEAWRELQREMPETFGKMTLSEFKAMTPEEREKAMNSERRKREQKEFEKSLEDAQAVVDNLKEAIKNAIDKGAISVKPLKSSLKEAEEYLKLKQKEKRERDEIAEAARFEALTEEEKLKELNKKLDVYKKLSAELEKQIPANLRNADAASFVLDTTKDGITLINDEWGKFDGQTWLNIHHLNVLNGKIQETNRTISGIENANKMGQTYAQAKAQAKKEYEDAVKLLEAIKRSPSKYTKTQYDEAVKSLSEKKETYEDLGGKTIKKTAAERAKELAEFKDLEAKQGKEKERAIKDIYFEVKQAEIDSLKEGYEKTEKQMSLNHKKELEELDRQREDFLQRKIDNAKALFEANPANEEKVFDSSGIGLTEKEQEGFDKIRKSTEEKQKRERQEQLEETLKKYKNHKDKLLDVEKDFNKKLEEIQTLEDKKSVTKSKADAMRKQAKEDKDKEVRSIVQDILSDEEENLKGLQQLYSELDGSTLVNEQLKKAIPLFHDISTLTLSELKQAKEIIDNIEVPPELLEKLKQAGVDVQKLIDALEKAKKASGEALDERKWEKVANSAERLANSLGKLGDALQQTGGALGEIGGVLSGLSSSASDIVNIIQEAGKEGGGDVISIVSSGISGLANLYSIVATQIEKNKQAQEEWNAKIREAQHQMNLMRIEQYEYKEANIFGVENPYKRAIDGAKQYAEAMGILNENLHELNSGKVQTGTENVVSGKNVAGGIGAGAAAGAAIGTAIGGWALGLGTVIGAAIGAVVGGVTGALATETVPVFENLVKEYGSILKDTETFELNPEILANYDSLNDKTKEIVDNWEEIRQKALEAQEQMRDTFRELAGDIGGKLSDALVDAFRNDDLRSSLKSFKKDVTEIIENIVSQLVFSQYFQHYFDTLQKEMEASFDEGGDQSIVDDILRMYEGLGAGLEGYGAEMERVQKELKKKGIDLFGKNAEGQGAASYGAYERITQDQADRIDGRLTGIHMETVNQSASLLNISIDTADIRQKVSQIREHYSEMNGLSLIAVNHLEQISKNTNELYETNRRLDKIEKNTSRL